MSPILPEVATLAADPVLADAQATDAAKDSASGTSSWRDVLKIHPAAEIFPHLFDGELRELAEDIKRNGQRVPIALFHANLDSEELLDGRSRLDAMELAGLPIIKNGALDRDVVMVEDIPANVDPYAYVVSVNIHRRHLSAEKKRELISTLLKAKPEQSNRAIGKLAKADDKTVASVRRGLQATAEIPQLEKTVGADKKSRPTRKTNSANGTGQVVGDEHGDGANGRADDHDGGDQAAAARRAGEPINQEMLLAALAGRRKSPTIDPAEPSNAENDGLVGGVAGKPTSPAAQLLKSSQKPAAMPGRPVTPPPAPRQPETLIEHWRRCPGEFGGLLNAAGLDVTLGAMSAELHEQLQRRVKQPALLIPRLRETDDASAAQLLLDAFGSGRLEKIMKKVATLRAPKGRKAGSGTRPFKKAMVFEQTVDAAGNKIFAQPRGSRIRH